MKFTRKFKNLTLKKALCFIMVTCSILTSTGCSVTEMTDRLQDPEKLYAKLHANPRFWNDTVKLDLASGLYKLSSEFFNGKPYNDIHSFGENVLLVGQGLYDKETYEYSFSVYDPWKNSITYELEHDKIQCTSYKITDDRLYLINEDEGIISEYDTSLNKINTYDTSIVNEFSTMDFVYGNSDYEYYYEYDSTRNAILKIKKEDMSYSYIDCDFYEPTIEGISDDGKYLLISGTDSSDLKYKTCSLSTENLNIADSIQGLTYNGAINNLGFVTEADYDNSLWNYHSFSGNDIYFKCKNVQDVSFLPNGTMIFHQEKYIDETSKKKHSVCYYQIDSTGKCISSFKFNCGVPSSHDYNYFSPNYVYLEDCDCIMFLVYTKDCMPFILIWDLKEGNKENFNPKVYTDKETALKEINAEKKDDDENYGDEVTLIEDTSSYDWGELSQINSFATKLEETYDIEIYLGPEVPLRIDYFDITQELNPNTLQTAMDNLSDILQCYPSNFFKQLCFGDNAGVRFYLSGELVGGSEGMIEDPSGFTSEINNHMVIVLDTGYSWDWDYTVNHEISHMIDRRLDFQSGFESSVPYSEEKWNSFNPDSFEYLDSYDNYNDKEKYKNNTKYFFDSYGTTFATEDRAEIFGNAMDYYINELEGEAIFTKDSPLTDKLTYYCKCIRAGFDTSNWDAKMPWEKFAS